jgi:hypothetical protein
MRAALAQQPDRFERQYDDGSWAVYAVKPAATLARSSN